MSTKRRRIIDDEDDKGEDDNDNSNGAIQRMLQKTKSKNITKVNNMKGAKGNDNSEAGIPRKAARTDEITIPRSKNSKEDFSSTIDNKESKTNTNTPSELSLTKSMLPAPGALANAKPKPAPFRGGGRPLKSGKPGPQLPEGRSQRLSPVRMIENGWDSTTNSHQPPQQLRDEERRVLSTLKTLCTKIKLEINPTEDLLSGSFLSNDQMMDYMDDDSHTRVPIFPEDFPAGGPKEWPLSWWGILDPITEKDSFPGDRSRNDRGHWNDRNPPPKNRGEWQGQPNDFPPQQWNEDRKGPPQSHPRNFPPNRGHGRAPPRY
mmetsp:Transcript_31874/g.48495  ORF Transcript_31874/g.48495 Transcript_31874/m.48495 type:complete len:318 (+) Transcript_31874:47-1000(+)